MIKRRMMRARLSLAFITLMAATPALAGTNNIFGSWTYVQITGDFGALSPNGNKYLWSIMDAVRTRDDEHLFNPNAGFSPRYFEDLIWIQAGYKLTENSSIWLGYTHHWADPFGGGNSFQESRPYQQYLWSDGIGSDFKLTMRTRLEELIPLTGPPASGSLDLGDVAVRIRQLAGISHPVPGVKGLSWYLANEGWFFLNNGAFGRGGFDQTRPMVGLTYQATRHLGLKLGYLGQYINVNGGDDLFTHNVQFGIHYGF